MEFYGVEFAEDEYTYGVVDGQPEVLLNRKGIERACALSPDQEKATAFREWFAAKFPEA